MDKLSRTIDDFYTTFAAVPKPERVFGCPCCIDEVDLRTLIRIPLRELTDEQLGTYASAALLTVGGVEDYLYFRPRILKISILDEWWWPNIEVTARAISSTGLTEWAVERRIALLDLLQTFVGHIVKSGEYSRIDSWLCAIGRMELDVRPFLEIIEKDAKAVLAYWEDNSGKLNEGKLGNAFWDPPTKQHNEIVRWFNSPKINLMYAEAYGYR